MGQVLHGCATTTHAVRAAIKQSAAPISELSRSTALRDTRRPKGKIKHWHQTLKNRILLKNYFFSEDLEAQIAAFVEHYNHRRYHESIGNLTPADVYFGRGQAILMERERIKRETIRQRRLQHRQQAA